MGEWEQSPALNIAGKMKPLSHQGSVCCHLILSFGTVADYRDQLIWLYPAQESVWWYRSYNPAYFLWHLSLPQGSIVWAGTMWTSEPGHYEVRNFKTQPWFPLAPSVSKCTHTSLWGFPYMCTPSSDQSVFAGVQQSPGPYLQVVNGNWNECTMGYSFATTILLFDS